MGEEELMVMDVPEEVLEQLKCPECDMYLSQSPVYLRHDGAAACGGCFSPKRPATRNTHYEAIARLVRFSCRNRELGCRETVGFAAEGQEVAHEATCEYRQYMCPVLGSARCDWLGLKSQILQHCRAQHPNQVLGNPCSLAHDISTSSLHSYVLQAFQLLFLLQTKVCVATSKIYHSIRLLDATDMAQDFIYRLQIRRNEEEVTKEGDVAPQGCLALQEPTALALDINSLLGVLGGWGGATCTVAVERRPKICAGCGAIVAVMLYRDESGWRCESCAPAREACKYQARGCAHKDIPRKCKKHELYFCEQRTECLICYARLLPGTVSAHYASSHMDVTHGAGSTWRAMGTGLKWRWCLVTCPAGTAVCTYRLYSSVFDLWVQIPVVSERLCEFRCEVRVTQPTTGLTHTYTPDTNYKGSSDWRVKVDVDESEDLAMEYEIASMPTFVFIKRGEQFSGANHDKIKDTVSGLK